MKALCTQIAERKAWLIENHKCVAADFSPLTFYRENGELDEEKTLSAINKYSKSKGFKESVEIRESIRRNNGRDTVVTESNTDLATAVKQMQRSYGMTAAEAICILKPRGDSYGLSEKEMREAWAPYANILSESEIDTLVERKVSAPKK